MYDEYRLKTENAVRELLQRSGVKSGDLVVVGCSSSEVLGEHIGKGSSPETGKVIAETILNIAALESPMMFSSSAKVFPPPRIARNTDFMFEIRIYSCLLPGFIF